ncbi:tryptophan halogenase family protein [Asticcacaulis sp. AND118]|uniref:tryptophan halogenase family protein n=1 Tax=Asticcacaulis sp. AND118 TaxID=2840468 RepID=UPI001CFFF88D|nr:tryptophan halogenase family protein [Asticcacaulis sp. AND118]UDF03051.1 tryptophan 7-halogenase [Asticcacaulis sp. AND118]
MSDTVRSIVILGGGTAGWMAAACLSRVLGTKAFDITLIESPDIGTVGVGEATIPMIDAFHRVLGLTPQDIIRETEGTFKLGIEFVDWRRPGHSYFHPFGGYGQDLNGIGFMHHWLRLAKLTHLWDHGRYSFETLAARSGRFSLNPAPGQPRLNYAYHFDASLYAATLRRYAERLGVKRVAGTVNHVSQAVETGFVTALHLNDEQIVTGDLFIDCSGFRGVLIEQTLKAGYEDWSHWLPCNRAFAVPSRNVGDPDPFTRSTAREAGWQWRIPLRHRTGNGYVFCDGFMEIDAARDALMSRLEGEALAEPRLLGFTTGRRRRLWDRNVVALGLSGGFLEPLESTAIHLIQSGLTKLMVLFPRGRISPVAADQYNHLMHVEYERIRDFIIAHYKLTEREDTAFWAHCRHMPIPDSLSERLSLFAEEGIFLEQPHDLFKESNWFSVLVGQGLIPQRHHPIADAPSPQDLNARLQQIAHGLTTRVDHLPSHAQSLTRCL